MSNHDHIVANTLGPQVRIAAIEGGKVVEFFIEKHDDRGLVGNIYNGRVTRVLPGMQAAFIDLGDRVERNGYLHVDDIPSAGVQMDADSGRRKSRAKSDIKSLLKVGQHITVQVTKNPMSTKGARLTGFVSLPGRYGVLLPGVDQVGVSRRIIDKDERARLRAIVSDGKPTDMGFIARTAAEGVTQAHIAADFDYLLRLWKDIKSRSARLTKPDIIYSDLDLLLRTLRDYLHVGVARVIIDRRDDYQRACEFAREFLPNIGAEIVHYDGDEPIFSHFNVETKLQRVLSRRVDLRSGGHIIFDQGEALTAIDVNTGSFVGKKDLETTATKNNIEAAREIASQLRLRNIGGLIVIDFVDMEEEENRARVAAEFEDALGADMIRCSILPISELGLLQMTRRRVRSSLQALLTESCRHCGGSGRELAVHVVAGAALRELRTVAAAHKTDLELHCARRVLSAIAEHQSHIEAVEREFAIKVAIVSADEGEEYRIVPAHDAS